MITIIIITGIIIIGLYIVSKIIGQREINREKISIYECGNIPTEIIKTNTTFKVKYYKVGIIYLIFDLETLWLYPIYTVDYISTKMYIIILLFLLILILGVIYEIQKGLLNNI